MSDGANCMIVAKVGWVSDQVVIVGGNCSVTFLDIHGTEIFWTVMGGIVTSLAVFDFDGDGENEVDIIDRITRVTFIRLVQSFLEICLSEFISFFSY